MGLLQDIQTSVVQENADVCSALLKLQLLAARLGSNPLEEWVKYEIEGYSHDAPLPSYRMIGVTYRASFSGSFGAAINNAPIPTYLIDSIAGEQWTKHAVRESIAAVDELVHSSADRKSSIGIDASNLILILQGKIYKNYVCNEVIGLISSAALAAIKYAVRKRVLEVTIELERSVPESTLVEFGSTIEQDRSVSDQASRISNQIIYGNVTSISSTGSKAQINVKFHARDEEGLARYLTESGITTSDAEEFAEIVASEEPISRKEPFGENAKEWVIENMKKAADGTWKIGVSVATKVLTEAALKFYDI